MAKNLQNILAPMRPPFLVLPPVCVLLGAAAAYHVTGRFDLAAFLLVLLGAVAAHISVNALNEYFDFRSGLDFRTRPTPFSGGTGTLPRTPAAAPSALATGLITLVIAAGVGVYFLVRAGWGLLPLGLLGLLVIYFYTNVLLRNPLASLIAPGLGFGVLMVMGAAYALGAGYTWTSFVASLVPTFLVSNLLLLNQFPDADADQTVGRRHYPILIGRPASARIYVALLAATYLVIILGVLLRLLPAWALLGLVTAPLAFKAGQTAIRQADNIPQLIPALVQNVLLNILTPLLTAIGVFIGG